MYFLRTEANFDAAHFLKDYRGKCGNIHGHRWRILCEIAGKDISKDIQNRGMLVDFKDIKSTLKEICEVFDHNFIYEKDSLKDATLTCLKNEGFLLVEVDFRPTAENFSRYIFEELQKKGVSVRRVEVYETPNNFAAYQEE